jgi:hypothetical protein
MSPHAQCQDSYYFTNGNTCMPQNLTNMMLDLFNQAIKHC